MKITTNEWADKYRFIAAGTSPFPGKYRSKLTPWVPGMLDALDDKLAWKVVCMKSAQVAWTDGVMNNYIGKRIHVEPCPMIVMFPKMKAYERYHDHKLVKMIEATPVLRERVDTASRKSGNRKDFKQFERGFLQLIASNAADDAKSTPAPVVMVEEPDDCNANIIGHGDSIKLLEERTKFYPISKKKVIVGGTPTIKGFSTIEDEFNQSDRRQYFVPCHACDESHVLSWDNVHWDKNADIADELYDHHQPDTAHYACPQCGVIWDDTDKNRAVRKGGWQATREFRGIAGFHISELYSPFPASRFARLVEKYLAANAKYESGDDSELMVFYTHTLGLPYEVKSTAPQIEELEKRALSYEEKLVPHGGLILTAGVDVQHDRLAVIVRAWGRDEESWLVYWGELYGAVNDSSSGVWDELEALLFAPFKHECGVQLKISGISIDSSDGGTNDAVYAWVRMRQHKGVMAIKGASVNSLEAEIFRKPLRVDTSKDNTKAAKYGLAIYSVGTHKAKNLFDKRLGLEGRGAGRMHWYKDIRSDYFEQITSEVLAPVKGSRAKKAWQKKSGVRNEALDCEVYALHASRSCKVHLIKPHQWDYMENQLKQGDIFAEPAEQSAPAEKKVAAMDPIAQTMALQKKQRQRRF